MAPLFRALIDYDDTYIQPLLLTALSKQLPSDTYTLITDTFSPITNDGQPSTLPLLQIRQYESLDFEHALAHPHDSLCNAYVIRKALIRKHFLSRMVREWTVKYPDSVLKGAWKECVEIELDYAEFLEEALDESESWELVESLGRNERVDGVGGDANGAEANAVADSDAVGSVNASGDEGKRREREYWILKPGMSDRGQGIRLFSTMDELRAIFEAWEVEEDDDAEEDEDAEVDRSADDAASSANGNEGITTHHLRHFLLQPYIHPPLLIPDAPYSNRKFHIRTYVVAYGALEVFVYKPMLALFASESYVAPWEMASSHEGTVDNPTEGENEELLRRMRNIHVTNTCVQKSTSRATEPSNGTSNASSEQGQENVFLLADLPLPPGMYRSIATQIDDITAELFRAAVAQPTNFQPLPQAFEVFGVDFLIEDSRGKSEKKGKEDVVVQLLEVNAFPDFAQTGERLRDVVVKGLWEDTMKHIIGPHFGVAPKTCKEADTDSNDRLAKVLDLDLHLV